jgi:hypothetical protein
MFQICPPIQSVQIFSSALWDEQNAVDDTERHEKQNTDVIRNNTGVILECCLNALPYSRA